jgi:hypothetical protein
VLLAAKNSPPGRPVPGIALPQHWCAASAK